MGEILGPTAPTPRTLVTVAEAASRLGATPWDVMRLIEAGEIEAVVYVDPASLEAVKEKSS